jgi:NarL family two-component system response regulator LiaR
MTHPIRILIADDHAVVRQGLRSLIEYQSDMKVVGEAADGMEAISRAQALHPDVVLLDLVMPHKSGLEAIPEIVSLGTEIRVLVLTSFGQDEQVFPAIKAGALGYLLKDTSPQDLLRAIREVHRGKSFLHPLVARKLIREISEPATSPPIQDPLTERETQVLQLIARGLSNDAIADRLSLSERTVRNYVSTILNKLHLDNRVQAALYALQQGLINLEDAEIMG